MTLKGHGNDLSLVDLIQVSALAQRTCHIRVRGLNAEGGLFLEKGKLVHAAYGDQEGPDAVYSMIADEFVLYEMNARQTTDRRTVDRPFEEILLEAVRLKDEAALAEPVASEPPRAQLREPERRPVKKRKISIVPIAGAFLAVVAFVGWYAAHSASNGNLPESKASLPAAASASFDATELTGAADSAPRLVFGNPPLSPRPELPLKPTIVCRLLVGEDGRVLERQIYRSRLDLEIFEEAALDAVASYRFEPGTWNGEPVSAWVNLPVTFR